MKGGAYVVEKKTLIDFLNEAVLDKVQNLKKTYLG